MSSRRPHLILVALIVAALAGVGFLVVPGSPVHKKVTLGLDLQGGLEVILKAQPPKGHALTASDLDRSVTIMRSRVDKLGVSEPEIRKQGSNQISVELAGIHNPGRAAQIIGQTATLELYDLETSLADASVDATGNPIPHTSLYDLLSGVQSVATNRSPTAYYLFDKHKKLVAGPSDTKQKLLKRRGGQVPKGDKLFLLPQNTAVITCGTKAVVCPGPQGGVAPTRTLYYLFKHDLSKNVPQLTGADLKLSGTRADVDPDSNQPEVLMQFTGKGGSEFQKITEAEYARGQFRQAPQHFAIVLDDQIQSFPQIDFTDSSLAGGIAGGSARITGIQSMQEAKDLALVLQTGALPVKFVTIERTEVSATLGKDSLSQAKHAAIYGLIVVGIFLLLFYRFLGLVAVIGLGIYAAFLYAAILLFGVTLTLPGFAGMILTIGVAADANVVVFERIKEEVRAGKSVRAAIGAGYSKGFRTILDANVVTAITAVVLFAVATAGVKGFALLLLIGTIISLITAVAATRAMLGLLAGFRWFDNPRLMGAEKQQGAKWLQIDFMRRRYLWFAISGVVVLVSAVSLGVRGLNLGIDFRGGTQITFKTPKPIALTAVRAQTAAVGQNDAVVQGRGQQVNGEFKAFQLRTRTLTSKAQADLDQGLARLGATSLGVKNVSASFGRQIARDAVLAVIFSLLLIVLYIAIRFDVKYSVPVIGALLHDIVITVGIYSITGREVSEGTVAAVLTVLGYSIYDTIIIFDRIRENVPLMRRSSYATIVNVSLWETIRRSLATTFITLLPVAALLVYGGATLKDFAFALIVGISSGAYSSIFIAAPLLTMFKEQEPEYARRRDSSSFEGSGKSIEPVLEAARAAAAEEPVPAVVSAGMDTPGDAAKRERRRQRRKTRPHGRAR